MERDPSENKADLEREGADRAHIVDPAEDGVATPDDGAAAGLTEPDAVASPNPGDPPPHPDANLDPPREQQVNPELNPNREREGSAN